MQAFLAGSAVPCISSLVMASSGSESMAALLWVSCAYLMNVSE
jgi:hypothetical protein